jgi:crossover junction endodeoxyribonuclease RuvC
MCRGVLAALGIPVVLVRPQAWKRSVLAGLAHVDATAIGYCASRWLGTSLVLPRCRKSHDGMADALALAEYARRQSPAFQPCA